MAVECLACKGDSVLHKKVNNCDIYICQSCWMEFMWPMPTDKALDDYYGHGNYEDVRADPKVTALNGKQNLDHIEKEYKLDKSEFILDFGCGKNQFVNMAQTNGFKNAFGFDAFQSYDELDHKEQLLSDTEINAQKWDFITSWGVLDNQPNFDGFFEKAKSLLKDKGSVIATVKHTEGKIPFRYKPIEHLLYFTKASIEAFAKKHDFTVTEYRDYYMHQNAQVYLDILTRTVPDDLKSKVVNELPEYVHVPTNEVFIVLTKN